MRKGKLWGIAKPLMLAVVIAAGGLGRAYAETASSSSYTVTDTQFTNGSTAQTCSTNYCSQAGIGTTAAGHSDSSTASGNFGPVTGSEPLLDVIVDSGSSDLGTLSTETTATKTMSVKIRNYLSSGYVLEITGDPPKYGSHTLATPGVPTLSTSGVEQFGINAVANTSPAVGADPVQVPSGEFSFGEAYTGYNTTNHFQYHSGDAVAHSVKSSGETDFTISMIINIANGTPAGHYSGDFSAVVIPVY
jgi:hypothetical protein